MFYVELIAAFALIIAFLHFVKTKHSHEQRNNEIAREMNDSEEMKRTLAAGLYLRFQKQAEGVAYSAFYDTQDPLLFEDFVAEVIELAKGGSTWVTPPVNDQGVDFHHDREDGLYLGQVKCSATDVGFEPIAVLHSQMIKQDAKGGYVISTAGFTNAAREYAKDVSIQLVDGMKLAEWWLEARAVSEEDVKAIIPQLVTNKG
ncbi:restriction endonuclease [Bacillus fonticola]|uniref:restriction endonuclease n=1 Tax=Bacillus fonticola TaxID=2728853 RepID=UPI001D14DC8F|nr:restriction endonuclease [Bacillus fonticola]